MRVGARTLLGPQWRLLTSFLELWCFDFRLCETNMSVLTCQEWLQCFQATCPTCPLLTKLKKSSESSQLARSELSRVFGIGQVRYSTTEPQALHKENSHEQISLISGQKKRHEDQVSSRCRATGEWSSEWSIVACIGTRPEQTRTFSLWVDLDCKNPVDLKESVTDVATDDVLLRS